MLLVIGFLLWLNFGTKYELTQTELKYKSGDTGKELFYKKAIEVAKKYNLPTTFNPINF